MAFRVAVAILGTTLMGAGVWAQQRAVPPPASTSSANSPVAGGSLSDAQQNALVEEFCTSCHNSTVKSGELILERFNVASPFLSAELLEKMIRKLRSGQMPPADMERPDDVVMTAFVDALETRADTKASNLPDPGWRPFQRLNRAEYALVIKDLLAVDIDPSEFLPPDTISGGFDNIADVQNVSPSVISAYLRGAAAVSRKAAPFSCTAAGPKGPASTRRASTGAASTGAASTGAASSDAACAKSIITKLAGKAYRGSATDIDIADALAFFERGRAQGTFDDGIRLAIQSMLVSPKFLFRLESASVSGVLSDLALASRLSFFLWSTGPDAALIAAAKSGRLHTPEQLAAQARRMILDPRAEALSTRFAAQWLRLQDLGKVEVDAELANAMRRETELTFADVVRRDASVMDLVTSNRSFINARLAEHYGVPGVRGTQFRPVTMPETRRGLLGQGSILTLTSIGTRTSPVLRGKWVLDVLLGTPPPPPPPNVPALEDSTKAERGGVPLTTRQRVEEHRSNPSCAGCHRVIDPAGMALENFDATGAWRTKDNGANIDPTATLYDGRQMNGAAGLRDALLAHEDIVLRNFTQQLMTYALGRRVTYRDMPMVRAIVRSAAATNNRFSSFVTGIVTSDAFRKSKPKD